MSAQNHPELHTFNTEPHATDTAVPAALGTHHQRNERGATAVEYALMVGLISVAIIGSVSILGGRIGSTFSTVDNSLTATAAAPAASGWTNVGPGYVAPSGGIPFRYRPTVGVGAWSTYALPPGYLLVSPVCTPGGGGIAQECEVQI